MDVDRTHYTWDLATEDLARGSHLTADEAVEITYVLKNLGFLHPYDTATPLIKMMKLIRAPLSRQGAAVFAEQLETLLKRAHVREF